MKLDIVFVTYNSEKWIDNCINSILKSKYDLKNVSLYFYDNNSSDNTVKELNKIKDKNKNKFNEFKVINGFKNKGFGYGNNKGSQYGKGDYIFFLNIDTEILPDTLSKLEESIKESNKDVKMWELAQRPYEHPKYYDPISKETTWASGACMVVDRKAFERIGGFDTKIFMYCEDVDISWNFRRHGYKINYLFDNPINHYSYSKVNEFKQNQFVYGFINNWYLRSKYGNLKNSLRGALYVLKEAIRGSHIPYSVSSSEKKNIKKKLRRVFILKLIPYSLKSIFFRKTGHGFKPKFVDGLDYEVGRRGAFYTIPSIKEKPLVSVLVRTCGRPSVLRETLISLRNQTYDNLEVVVVEDGKNTAEAMIKKEFSDLSINYASTGNNVGRSEVGNIAIKNAKGKYLNFLDDDDLFYPDHVETLVSELESNNCDIVYSSAYETQIDVKSKEPYNYEITGYNLFQNENASRVELYSRNLFPIQAVMFKKDIVKETGGLDTNIDALEDWDFWIRLSLDHQFYYINRTTSIFRTPANPGDINARIEFLQSSLDYLHKKFKTYHPTLTVDDINNNK